MSYPPVTVTLEPIISPRALLGGTVSPYLDKLLAGYRQGLARDLPGSADAIRAALAGEDDPARRGALLGMLAQALVQQDQLCPTIDKPALSRQFVTEKSPFISSGASLPAA